jgi:predicted anti-sigma-YlaC factor YlaD
MTCTDCEASLVDRARGAIGAGVQDADVAQHLRRCPQCTALFDRERAISAALRLLAETVEEPTADRQTEAAVLAAFDAYWARPPRRLGQWVWRGVATAAVVVVTTLAGIAVRNAPHGERAASPEVAVEPADFVPWPGAAAGPPFESGELVRVDLPVSALPALGFWPPSSDVSFVQADVIVGQDGFARAVRLVQ